MSILAAALMTAALLTACNNEGEECDAASVVPVPVAQAAPQLRVAGTKPKPPRKTKPSKPKPPTYGTGGGVHGDFNDCDDD
ncbi:hypothetical protein [Streptomyces chryseus]